MWERYCRGVQAIVYVVDAADPDGLDLAKTELHELLHKPSLNGIPVLVLGNKNDIPGALSTTEIIDQLDLKVANRLGSISSESRKTAALLDEAARHLWVLRNRICCLRVRICVHAYVLFLAQQLPLELRLEVFCPSWLTSCCFASKMLGSEGWAFP